MKNPWKMLSEALAISEVDEPPYGRLSAIKRRAQASGQARDFPSSKLPGSWDQKEKDNVSRGRCMHCGKPLAPTSSQRCVDCVRKTNLSTAKSAGLRRPGMCATCGKKTGDMTTRCKQCWKGFGPDKKTDRERWDDERRSMFGGAQPSGMKPSLLDMVPSDADDAADELEIDPDRDEEDRLG